MIRHLINRGRSVNLNGVDYRVYELTLGQLAEIEDIAYEAMPSGFLALYLDPMSEDYLENLKELRKRIRRWNPRYFPMTDVGMAHSVRLSMRLGNLIEAETLLLNCSTMEKDHITRLAYGHDDVNFLTDLIYQDEDEQESDGPRNPPDALTQMIDWVCRTYGWTIDYVLSLTVSQIGLCARGGKLNPESRFQKSTSALQEEWDRRCSRYHGEDGE